jgi:hypothetical protein
MKPADVRFYINEYVESLPKSPLGHAMFTYEEAVGLQTLQQELRMVTSLSLIRGGKFNEPPKRPLLTYVSQSKVA